MSTLAKRISSKKYRQDNYTKLTSPSKKNKVLKKCTICPSNYFSDSKFDRFCDPCRRRASGIIG
jgi:hypothetical protein